MDKNIYGIIPFARRFNVGRGTVWLWIQGGIIEPKLKTFGLMKVYVFPPKICREITILLAKKNATH